MPSRPTRTTTGRHGRRRRRSCSRGSSTSASRWISNTALVAAVLVLGACRETAPSQTTRPEPAARTVTYHADIAPILFQHCASCHRPITTAPNAKHVTNDPVCVAGAPFSLLEYATVKAHASEIAEATATRAMPPWLPQAGAHRFANERRLSDAQIALLQQWVDQG